MDLTGRPRYDEFHTRLDSPFTVIAEDGSDAGAWQLLTCKRLEKPLIEALADHDCFLLTFDANGQHWPQGLYRFTAPDGFHTQLVASPAPHNRMQATIN